MVAMKVTCVVVFFAVILFQVDCQGTCSGYGVGEISECTSGFASLYQIDVAEGNTGTRFRNRIQAIYPNITFNCTGRLTKWIFAAAWAGFNTTCTELQIWRKRSGGSVYDKVGGTTVRVDGLNNTNVYEYIADPPLEFQRGDILGYFQPDNERSQLEIYLEESERTAAVYVHIDSEVNVTPVDTFDLFSHHYSTDEYPLIAIETDPPDCGCGFMSQERINAVMGDILVPPGVQRDRSVNGIEMVFPDIKFLCSGHVNHFIMGARWKSILGHSPEVQIWRPSGETTYQKLSGTTVAPVDISSDGIYIFAVDPPVLFEPGDILGVFQPALSVSRLSVDFDIAGAAMNYYVPVENDRVSPSLSTIDVNGEGVMSQMGLPLITVVVGTQPLPTPATGGSGGSDDTNTLPPFMVVTRSSASPLATPCRDAQAIDNNKSEPTGDHSDETLHLRLLSVTVILLVVAGTAVIIFVCVRSFVQKKARKRGFDRRDGNDMTGNPLYNASTAITTHPFLLSPLLRGSTAVSRLSNNTCYENPDRLYENPDRYGEVTCGRANICGVSPLLDSAYASSEDGHREEEKYNAYTIATPLNPAYSSLQRQQDQNHPLTLQLEEPQSDESILDICIQSPLSALIVPMNGEIMKTPSQLFEILQDEPDINDTSTVTTKHEKDGGKKVEEEEDGEEEEEGEREGEGEGEGEGDGEEEKKDV